IAQAIREGRIRSLPDFLDAVAGAIERRETGAVDPMTGLLALTALLEDLEARLRGSSTLGRSLLSARPAPVDAQGYHAGRDGGFRGVMVGPAPRSDENAVVLPLVAGVRKVAADVAAKHPGVRVRTTGLYALQADESRIVDHDMLATTIG